MKPALSRYSGLAAVAALWSTLGAASLLSGFGLLGQRPLSSLAAIPASSRLFSAGLVVGAVLLAVFHRDVRARYRVGAGFSVAMLAGLAGQVTAAVVPIEGGLMAHRVHTGAALMLGASLPVLMWRFAAAQPTGRWRRVSYHLFWLEVGACAVGVVLSRHSVAPLAEILPAACFHLWTAVLTLSRFAGANPRGSVGRPMAASRRPRRGAPTGWRRGGSCCALGPDLSGRGGPSASPRP